MYYVLRCTVYSTEFYNVLLRKRSSHVNTKYCPACVCTSASSIVLYAYVVLSADRWPVVSRQEPSLHLINSIHRFTDVFLRHFESAIVSTVLVLSKY